MAQRISTVAQDPMRYSESFGPHQFKIEAGLEVRKGPQEYAKKNNIFGRILIDNNTVCNHPSLVLQPCIQS